MTEDPLRTYLTRRGVAPQVVEGGIEYLVRGWEHTAREVEDGYELEIEDWLNDLDGRQILADARQHVSEQEWGVYADRVAAADDRFRRGTIESDGCLWGQDTAQNRGWTREINWWYWRRPT